MKTLALILCAIFFNLGTVMASETVISKYIESPKEVGSAKFEYIFWDVYFATLYAPSGVFDSSEPYALSLRYLRDFEGQAIAERSIKEMKEQGLNDKQLLADWEQAMVDLFPNVRKGQTITGIASAEGHAVFYLDEDKIGSIDDANFTQKFFDIWLSEKTSETKLRQKLLKL